MEIGNGKGLSELQSSLLLQAFKNRGQETIPMGVRTAISRAIQGLKKQHLVKHQYTLQKSGRMSWTGFTLTATGRELAQKILEGGGPSGKIS